MLSAWSILSRFPESLNSKPYNHLYDSLSESGVGGIRRPAKKADHSVCPFILLVSLAASRMPLRVGANRPRRA